MRGVKGSPETFWKSVDAASEGCWIFTGPKDKDGYGQFMVMGKNRRAHRYAMEISGKPIPDGKVARHLCNTPACVRPDHIVAGTQSENVRDQVVAGTHARLKYDDATIDALRAEYATGTIGQRRLAQKYGISKSHVGYLVTNGSRLDRRAS